MRHVRADQHQVSRPERFNVVRHKPGTPARFNERQLHFPVVMPLVPAARDGLGHASPDHRHVAHSPSPAQETERLVRGKADILAFDGHAVSMSRWRDNFKVGNEIIVPENET